MVDSKIEKSRAQEMIEIAEAYSGMKISKQSEDGEEKPKEPGKSSRKSLSPNVVQLLPSCGQDWQPIPNALLRGALFSVVGKGKRIYEKHATKASVNGVTVKATGETLDQADLDVWMENVRRAAELPLGEPIRFTAHSFLKSIGRNTGKSQHEWLKEVQHRLFNTSLEVSHDGRSYHGHLIHDWYIDERTLEHVFTLNPKLAVFFVNELWTGIPLEQRRLLKKKPLAQWLYTFYCTHEKPVPYKVETIANLCGSNISALRMFRNKLKKSLAALSDVTGWQCWIDKTDKVIVIKGDTKKKTEK